MDKEYAKYLLEKTRQDYDIIAEDFTRTRTYIPEDIRELGDYSLAGERILDSGCGSGRLFEVFNGKNIDYFGTDISERLIRIAQEKYPEAKFQTADALNLPFPENFFDKVYSISILHHIPSQYFQLQYLKEAKRVLKPGGILILRVWDFWRRKATPRLIFEYTFLKLIGRSKLDFKDVFVPWKDSEGEILVQRYFHCFTKKELENLAKKAGFIIKKIWRSGKDPKTNIYLVAEKQKPYHEIV